MPLMLGSVAVGAKNATPYWVAGSTSGAAAGNNNSVQFIQEDSSGNTYYVITSNIYLSPSSNRLYITKKNIYQQTMWAKSYGTGSYTNANAPEVRALYLSGTHLYISGQTFTASNAANAFLLKIDLNGSLIWKTQVASTLEAVLYALRVDGSDNVYAAGAYLNANNETGTCAIKFDSSGNILFQYKHIGNYVASSARTYTFGNYAYIDSNFNFVITENGPNLSTTQGNAGQPLVYMLNSSGALSWVRRYADGLGYCIGEDTSGNLYFTYNSYNQTYPTSPYYNYITKINSSGTVLAYYKSSSSNNITIFTYGTVDAANNIWLYNGGFVPLGLGSNNGPYGANGLVKYNSSFTQQFTQIFYTDISTNFFDGILTVNPSGTKYTYSGEVATIPYYWKMPTSTQYNKTVVLNGTNTYTAAPSWTYALTSQTIGSNLTSTLTIVNGTFTQVSDTATYGTSSQVMNQIALT